MRLSQKERVRRALARAGTRGIAQTDFLKPNIIDNGFPITRLAARIQELKAEGLPVETNGTRDECTVYLVRTRPVAAVPEPLEAPATTLAAEAPSLFDAPAAQPAPHWDEAA